MNRSKELLEKLGIDENFEGVVTKKLSAAKWKVKVVKVTPLYGDKFPKGKEFEVGSQMSVQPEVGDNVYVGSGRKGLNILSID